LAIDSRVALLAKIVSPSHQSAVSFEILMGASILPVQDFLDID
jgi:hypothetical protein